jgi:hypothetical protein
MGDFVLKNKHHRYSMDCFGEPSAMGLAIPEGLKDFMQWLDHFPFQEWICKGILIYYPVRGREPA